jgi:beta-galactosidase
LGAANAVFAAKERRLEENTMIIASKNLLVVAAVTFLAAGSLVCADQVVESGAAHSPRERLLVDFGWRFAFGHASDVAKDFNHATGQFSYFAKTGFGSGASGPDFDDSGWRVLNLPHDWAVEVPFDPHGSGSHGFKAVGRNFSETSVGWYRRSFAIPTSDLGRRISVEFDGVDRKSVG